MDNNYNTVCTGLLIVIAVIVLLCPILNALRRCFSRQRKPETFEPGATTTNVAEKCGYNIFQKCAEICSTLPNLTDDQKVNCTVRCGSRLIGRCSYDPNTFKLTDNTLDLNITEANIIKPITCNDYCRMGVLSNCIESSKKHGIMGGVECMYDNLPKCGSKSNNPVDMKKTADIIGCKIDVDQIYY